MKKILCLALCMVLILSFSLTAFASGLNDTEKGMLAVVDKNKAELFDISQKIWNLKEQGLEEVQSAALLEDALAKHGFAVQKGVVGIDPTNGQKVNYPTAFIATYEGQKGGPAIGILVEYDALPNGHACGHNLISESGFAAALALQEALKTTPGKVVVYGTPAEETCGSKPQMLAAGLMKGIDIMFEVHGSQIWSSELNVKAMVGPKYSNDPLKGQLIFTGKSSHASAAPEKGRSALDAAMLMGIGLEFLREHMLQTDRVHYAILNGGKAANVVPDFVKVDIMVRAESTAELKDLIKRTDKIIAGAAMMTETTATYEWDVPLLNAIPVPEFWRFVARTATDVGVSEDQFQFNTPAGGSTDAGNVGAEIPISNIWFPVTTFSSDQAPALHSDAFRDAAGTEYAMGNSMLAGKIIALSAYRLLTNPVELQKIKDEFAKNNK